MNIERQRKGASLLAAIGLVVNLGVGLVYTSFLVRLLGKSEYGLYQLVLSVVNYLNLMNFGFSGSYIRYYTEAIKKGREQISRINGMFLSVFVTISCLCIVMGVALYANIDIMGRNITYNEYELARKLVIPLVLNIAVMFANTIFVAFMSANSEFVIQKIVNIISNIILPIITIPLLLGGGGALSVAYTTLGISFLKLVFNLYYCIKKLCMQIQLFYFDRRLLIDIGKYTFFIFLR